MNLIIDNKTFELIKDKINNYPICLDKAKVKDDFKYRMVSPEIYDSNLLLDISEQTEFILTYIKTKPYYYTSPLTGLKINNINTATLVYKIKDKNGLVITDTLVNTVLFSNIIILLGECTADTMITIDKLDFLFLMSNKDEKIKIINLLLEDIGINNKIVRVEKLNITGYEENKSMNRIDVLTMNVTFNYKNTFLDINLEWNLGNDRLHGYLSINGRYLNKDNILEILLDKIIKEREKDEGQ